MTTIGRQFREGTRRVLGQVISRLLHGVKLAALFADGIRAAAHTLVVATRLDGGGRKQVLPLWEGATVNCDPLRQCSIPAYFPRFRDGRRSGCSLPQ